MKNLKIKKEVEERYNKYFSKYEKRLDEMENKLDKKVELDEVKALIQENKECRHRWKRPGWDTDKPVGRI
jgi:IS1 family transposase